MNMNKWFENKGNNFKERNERNLKYSDGAQ